MSGSLSRALLCEQFTRYATHKGQQPLTSRSHASSTACFTMHQSARLTAPVERTFSDRASWRGYLLIGITFAAMTIFTLITRGMSPDCHTFARSATTFDTKICNESLVYAGQTFQPPLRPNVMFQVAAWTRIAGPTVYREENCRILSVSEAEIELITRPTTLPKINPTITLICDDHRIIEKGLTTPINIFRNETLFINSIAFHVQKLTPGSYDLLRGVNPDGMQKNLQDRVRSFNTAALSLYRDADAAEPGNTGSTDQLDVLVLRGRDTTVSAHVTSRTTGDARFEELRDAGAKYATLMQQSTNMMNDILDTVLSDASNNVLNGLSFPCTTCRNRWKANTALPILQLLWSVLIGCASIWALSRFFAQLWMSRLEEPALPADVKKQVLAASSPHTPSGFPMSPAPQYSPTTPFSMASRDSYSGVPLMPMQHNP